MNKTYTRMFQKFTNAGDANFFAKYPKIPDLNRDLTIFDLISMGSYAEDKFESICDLHKNRLSGNVCLDGHFIQYQIIELVAIIRLLFDRLISMGYVYVYYNDFAKDKKIIIDSIGQLKNQQQKYAELYRIIFGDENYQQDESGFLTLLNNLSNYFKHGFLIYESHGVVSSNPDIPTITIPYTKNNNFNDWEWYTYNLCEMMRAFQNNVKRIGENQQKWFDLHKK
ncbi:hypothetical protein [Helicobacter canis]|uniref:hypothetical protein n=1 Tax=Helicobacter canis TaxID=29419 RepID=UPI002942DE1F|nr:hypothetical protein [Helicobacter canis]